MAASPSYPPIEDYGLIGDCHSAALISSQGSIDWLCLPSFDSPSLFARILDLERGGAWQIAPRAAFHNRHQYLDGTNILETIFTTAEGRVRLLDFMPVSERDGAGPMPLRTVIRIVEGIEGEIEMESLCWPRPDYARQQPAFSVQGQEITFGPFALTGPAAWQVDEEQGSVTCRTTVSPGERAVFVLSHRRQGDAAAGATLDGVAALEATAAYWRAWAEQCSYHGPYRAAVLRSALTLKLLIYQPTGAIIAAPTTSLPEAIGGSRNWDYRYTWIRDASFTLYALLLAGFTEEDDSFFEWILHHVELEETGIQILYPISPDGDTTERILDHLEGYRGSRPVRIGNAAVDQQQLDVYGEVLDALYFSWKVGRYDPRGVWGHFRPLIDWVADNWGAQGMGIWEVRGGTRNFVYSKVMCWVALDRALKIVQGCGLDGDVERWRRERDCIRAEVFEKGWSDKLGAFKQSYEDELLDAANLMLPIVGFIDGDDPRMQSTIDATLRQLVVDGLCYRYLEAPEGDMAGREGAFVLCTFWLIDALLLAGRHEEAQATFDRMLRLATPLGLYAEEIDASTGHHLGNFPQAFSHIGLISAAVSLAQVGVAGSIEPEQAAAAQAAGTGGGGEGQHAHSDHEDEASS